MRLSLHNSIFLAFLSQSLHTWALPVNANDKKNDFGLAARGTFEFEDLPEALAARALSDLVDHEIRAAESADEMIDARDWADDTPSSAALSARDWLDEEEVEGRALKGSIGRIARASVAPIKRVASALRPGTRRAASASPKKPTSKKPSSKKPSSKKPSSKTPSTKKPAEKRGKKGNVPSTYPRASGKSKGKGKSTKKPAGKSASAKTPKSPSSKGKGKSAGKGKGTGKEKEKGSKKPSKKPSKLGKKEKKKKTEEKPTRSRSRTFNVNIDPGNLINGAANLANFFGGQ